jgi:uncharacterized protein DUF3592
MFFRSDKTKIIAVILIVFGCYQLIRGSIYASVAKRENSTVGRITYVHKGKGTTYKYSFDVNGVHVGDDADNCKTPLTAQGCQVGGLVKVYYDTNDVTTTLLEEFGAAAHEELMLGTWVLAGGLLLLGVNLVLNRWWIDSGDSDDGDSDSGKEESGRLISDVDDLHVVPK